jgi:TPP-dependent pyruvate/acetoin dehydrogenase alpha subunit
MPPRVNDVSVPPVYPPPPSPPPETPPPLGAKVDRSLHPDRETARALCLHMLRSRAIEERIVDLYRLGKVTGGCYTGIGNEATSVGASYALAKDDVIVPTHRDMGMHLVRGHEPLEIMRQYLKRGTAQTEGKDSGLHLGVEGSNIVGMISHLAHMAPVAVGVALAERQLGKRTAVITTVGDGATSLGDFHEALNFAAVQKLPVLFIIENNQYAYSTPITLQYACERLSDRAVGYGMRGARVDGTDVIEVYAAAKVAVEIGRNGGGPTLIESVTMRMRGHSEHDDFKYVPAHLIDRWKKWDPIKRFVDHGLQSGFFDQREVEAMRARAAEEIDRAVELAEQDPPPDPSAAVRDVFRLWRDEWTVPSGDGWSPRASK